MRKNDLIELLQSIKGNPEIMFWNGLVGDVVPLTKNIFPIELHKNSLEYKKKLYEGEIIRQLMQDLPNNMDEDEKHKLAYVMLHSDKKLLDKIHKLASKNHVNRKYEYRPYVSDEDVKSGRLKCKTVFVLEAKKTGKSYLDRAGKINY